MSTPPLPEPPGLPPLGLHPPGLPARGLPGRAPGDDPLPGGPALGGARALRDRSGRRRGWLHEGWLCDDEHHVLAEVQAGQVHDLGGRHVGQVVAARVLDLRGHRVLEEEPGPTSPPAPAPCRRPAAPPRLPARPVRRLAGDPWGPRSLEEWLAEG